MNETAVKGTARSRILLIEDEGDIADSLRFNLEKAGGYTVAVSRTGDEGLALAKKKDFDLILLDLMLPDMDGLEVCRALRASADRSHLPILMLTARADESDKLIGLEIGADDYITKPFNMKELLARVKALLRRAARADLHDSERVYRGGGLEMDFEGHILRSEGREVPLTRMEFALLTSLVRSRGRVLTRSHLLEQVWGYQYHGGTRTVDVHVRRLRQKLGSAGDHIETVVGVGYRFREGEAHLETT